MPVVSGSLVFVATSKRYRCVRFLPRYPVMSSLNWKRSITIGFAAFFFSFSDFSFPGSGASASGSSAATTRRLPSGDQS